MARLQDKRRKAARQARVNRVADVLRRYTASPFEFEAACLYGLRSALCLQGWSWWQAHNEARQTVLAALDRIGARRPSWEMGQPECVHQHLDLTTRTRCARCFRRLPDERPKYCSDECHAGASADRRTVDQREANKAMKQAQRAAWRKQRTERLQP